MVDGKRLTPSQLLEYFRKNINSFINTSIANFSPYNHDIVNDVDLWGKDSSQILGAILHLDMTQDGSVIVSGYENEYRTPLFMNHDFTVSTIYSPLDGDHPVQGNRRWGIYTNTITNGYVFYTMGVDRISTATFALGNTIKNMFSTSGFEDADKLWRSMQDGMVSFINSHSGSAAKYSSQPEVIVRPEWSEVAKYLRGEITLQELKQNIGC